MPSNTPDRDRLLAETALGDWTTGPAAQFARAAACSARRRHRRKRILPAAAIACTLAIAALITQRAIPSSHPSEPTISTALATTTPPQEQPLAYEIISDTELLSLVTDRPLLVVQNAPDDAPVILAYHR